MRPIPGACFAADALAGRTALVSGAGGGIGAAAARQLAAMGACVAFADLDGQAAERALALWGPARTTMSRQSAAPDVSRESAVPGASIGSAAPPVSSDASRAYALDVTDAGACARLAERVGRELGPVSILVNCAGILERAGIDADGALQRWRRTFAVNVDGAHHLVLACLAQLKATRGCIVNVASIHSFASPPNSIAYTASKGAIAQFTRALAVELAPAGIRANAVAPGIVATAMTAVTRADETALRGFLAHVPMDRCGQPEEVAQAIAFLASDAAGYVTGVVLPVDGGYLAR